MSVLIYAKTSCASPSLIFTDVKITRNHGAFLLYTDSSLSAKLYEHIFKDIRAYSALAAHKKSVKQHFASRFRRMFARKSKHHERGEACYFCFSAELTKR